MKKKTPIILLCVVLVLGIYWCTNNRIGKKSDIQISDSDVSLIIKEGTLTNTGVTLIVKNNSDQKIRYGASFEVEIKKYGAWHKLKTGDQWFLLYAIELDAGESREIEHGFGDYGKLKKGTYRIIKDMTYLYENGKERGFNVAAEFTIK